MTNAPRTRNPRTRLSIVSSDVLESAGFYPGVQLPSLGETTAGAVQLATREGDRANKHTQVRVTSIEADAVLEGPIGNAQRGSWLGAVRRSYVNYVVHALGDEDSVVFGFQDGFTRLTYDVTDRQRVSFTAMTAASGGAFGGRAAPGDAAFRSVFSSFAWQ